MIDFNKCDVDLTAFVAGFIIVSTHIVRCFVYVSPRVMSGIAWRQFQSIGLGTISISSDRSRRTYVLSKRDTNGNMKRILWYLSIRQKFKRYG